MKHLGMLSVLLLVASAAAAQEAPRERPPIIDMHLHATVGTWTAENTPVNPATRKPSRATTADQMLPETLAALRRYNIVMALTSGPLKAVRQWRQSDPERIVGAPLFPSAAGNLAVWPELDHLRSEYRAGNLGAMGEITAQYVGISPSDPALEPYFALAEELDIPVGIHTGMSFPGITYSGYPDFRLRLGNPLLLEELLNRHPKLRVYIMHAGYPYLQETIAVLNLYPQVYADIAVINWIRPRTEFHEYLRRLMEAGFGKRILFGTDQMFWPEAIGMAVEGVESADFLTEEQRRDIFYHNAVRFLRLDQKEQ